ncbi:hypothetical protein KFK09_000715 [Dendrobium nobile]|uniref:Uncharacterized protein n=1 Tax=Dendrobium nobile TaxID=94219 RepID=A0A8T3CCN4_DENNO|nr:hypothetical protein KFK09_000715 [Dendrobium nobile]
MYFFVFFFGYFVAVRLLLEGVPFSCWIGSYDILIGSNDRSSLAVKVTFSLSRASSAKSRKSAESEHFGNPGLTTKRCNFPSTADFIYREIWFCILGRLVGFRSNSPEIRLRKMSFLPLGTI